MANYKYPWLAKNEPMQLTSSMGDPLHKAESPADRNRHALFCLTLVAATFVICLIRLGGFVQENAVNLLFDDQWALLSPLFQGQGPWSCFFLQDGPQRQGLGGLICWFLYWATGWNVRAEVWAEVVVLALATMTAIGLAVRLRGRLAWSDAAFPLLLLSLVHWETMTLVTMLAYGILPLLLVLLLACAWTVKNLATRVALVGVLGGLCLFTSYGLCGTVAAIGLALLLWLRPDQKQAKTDRGQAGLILLCLGGAVAIFAYGYRWEPGVSGWRFPAPNGWDYPRFCVLMFTSLLGFRSISVATMAVGAVLFGLVLGAFAGAAVMIWRREATARAKVVWILTGTSLFYVALTAIGRLPMSIQAAFVWRYMTMVTPGVCGLAIAAEGWVSSKPRVLQRCLAIGWIALAGIIWGNFLPEQYGAAVAKGKRIWIASYLRTHDLRTANKAADCGIYFPAPESSLIDERLRWLEQRHLSFFRDLDRSRPEESPPLGSGR
jgi:hypothetical protein